MTSPGPPTTLATYHRSAPKPRRRSARSPCGVSRRRGISNDAHPGAFMTPRDGRDSGHHLEAGGAGNAVLAHRGASVEPPSIRSVRHERVGRYGLPLCGRSPCTAAHAASSAVSCARSSSSYGGESLGIFRICPLRPITIDLFRNNILVWMASTAIRLIRISSRLWKFPCLPVRN